jgi:hypothetical protein
MTVPLSHAPRHSDLAVALSANHTKIDATPASDAEKAELHALLGTLSNSPFWAYLIVNGGLNGDWTDYIINRYRDDRSITGIKRFFALPLQEATRQRDAVPASSPCSMGFWSAAISRRRMPGSLVQSPPHTMTSA